MAADTAATIVRVRAIVDGLPGLNQLKTAMRGISAESKSANVDLRLVNDQLKSLKNEVNGSINNLRLQVQAFQAVRNSAQIGSAAYREATLRLKELNRELDKAEGRRRGAGDRLAGIGAVAGAGFFGGPEALLGSAAGLLAGGVGGAYAGAAIGAQIAQLRKAAMASAEYSQTIARLNIALSSVVKNSNEFAQAQEVINGVSSQLNVPILEATQGFTRLTAAVVGAGGNVRDSEIVFRGITNAIKATGGSAEDVQGALVAMSQVFSKGKVSAEELQGQLGERLPGAVTLFAQATGRTLPQLAKDLEQGAVGLNDLMKFAIALNERYSSSALQMAKSSEDSAARMKVALDGMGKAFGDFFKPVKQGIDDTIAGLANLVTRFLQASKLMQMGLKLSQKEKDDVRETARQIAALRERGQTPGARIRRAGIEEQLYQEGILDALKKRGFEAGILQPTGATPKPPSAFAEPKPTGEGGESSTLKKLQSEFGKTIGVIGRQLDIKTQRNMLKEVFNLEKQIEKITKSGTNEGVAQLRQRQKMVALETARKYLLEEQGLLYDEIKKAQQKGLNTTDAKLQLDRVSNEINRIDRDILESQNNEREKSIEQSKELAEKMKSLIPGYAEGGEAMPTIFQAMTDQLKEMEIAIQDIVPRLSTLADNLSNAFAGAFEGMVFSAQSAQESLAQMFTNIAKSFQNMVTQMIADYLKLQIMTFFRNIFAPKPISVAGNYFGGVASSTFTNPSFGFGGIESSLSSKTGLASVLQYGSFAMGGIMTGDGPLKLRRYASGGIASSPQLAMFGEGSRPEAYVPLPDGRSIPVRMQGGGGNPVVTVNVDASGTKVQGNAPQANELGRLVGAAVQAELIKQKRPGGFLA